MSPSDSAPYFFHPTRYKTPRPHQNLQKKGSLARPETIVTFTYHEYSGTNCTHQERPDTPIYSPDH